MTWNSNKTAPLQSWLLLHLFKWAVCGNVKARWLVMCGLYESRTLISRHCIAVAYAFCRMCSAPRVCTSDLIRTCSEGCAIVCCRDVKLNGYAVASACLWRKERRKLSLHYSFILNNVRHTSSIALELFSPRINFCNKLVLQQYLQR